MMSFSVSDVKDFPTSPGVYVMKNSLGEVLYVGKAKNLKKRVLSYFGREERERYQIKFLMERVARIEFIETDTEKEAILLEFKLIHRHRPKYNIDLKDNKSFVRVKLTSHAFPAIFVTRHVRKDDATYFGPFISATACREMVNQAVKFFKLRTCGDREFANRVRPCIQFDIGRCSAPCASLVSREAYAEQVRQAELFLSGKRRDLFGALKERMRSASEAMRYEEAASLRDMISEIRELLEKQKIAKADEADFETSPKISDDEAAFNAVIGSELKKRLKLKEVPHFIECVDISNISGSAACGAIISFADGRPMKRGYRLFNITRDEKPNDYAMMFEVLERRFKHAEWGVPDLLLVDGGRGQLSVASKVLNDLGVLNVAVVAIAKISGSHKKSSDDAQIFLPNRMNPVKFKKGEPPLLYLIRIRDEAHRFVISHHRKRRHQTLVV